MDDNKKLSKELRIAMSKGLLADRLSRQKFEFMRDILYAAEQRDMLKDSMRDLLLPLTKAESMAENGELKSVLQGVLASAIQALDEVAEYEAEVEEEEGNNAD